MQHSTLSRVLLLSAVTLVAAGPPRKPVMPRAGPVVIDFQRMTADLKMPTGLRVLMQADDNRPVVGVTTLIGTGSASDPRDKEGLAHLVEHLWFRSRHGGLAETGDVLADLGCVANARTAADWTDYITICPASAAAVVMRLESQRLLNPLAEVTEEVFLTEREVVRNEYRMRQENTVLAVLPYVFDVLYPPGHDYARLRASSHDSLDGLTLDDARGFVERHYRPDNAVVSVVGDIGRGRETRLLFENFDLTLLHPKLTPDLVFRAAAHGVADPDPDDPNDWALWAWDPDDTEKPLSSGTYHRHGAQQFGEAPPAPRATEPTTYTAAVEDPVTVVAWSLPGGFTPADRHLGRVSVYANLALWDLLPEKKRDLAFCTVMSGVQASTLMCVVVAEPGVDRERLADKVASGIPRRWSESAWVEQILRNRVFTVGELIDHYQAFEPVAAMDGRATRLAHHAWFTGGPLAFDDQRAAFEADPGKDLFKTFRRWVDRDRAVIVQLEPLPPDEWVVDSSEARHHGATALSRNPTLPPAQITDALLRSAADPPDVGRVAEATLDNGLHVVAFRHGSLAFVDLSLYLKNTGSEHDWLSFAMSREQRAQAETLPGEWGGWWTDGYTRASLFSASGNLDAALWMLRDSVEDMAVNGSPRDWAKDRQDALEDRLLEAWYWRDRMEREALDPGNPTRWEPTWDDYERLGAVPLKELRTTVKRKYQPDNALLVLVGDVDPQEAIERARFHWTGWRAKGGVEVGELPDLPVYSPEPTDVVLLFDEPHETQTRVGMRCTIPPGTELGLAADLASDVIENDVTTRLRRERGAAYWASASLRIEPNGFNQLIATTGVQNDSAGAAVTTIYDAVGRIERGEVTAAGLRPVLLGHALRTTLEFETIERASGWVRFATVFGWGWDVYGDYGGRLAALTPADLRRAIDGCSTHRVVTLTGPAAVIGPQLDDAGITYETVEWEAMGWAELERVNPKRAEKEREAQQAAGP